jgi:hypothetical protein
MKVNSSEIQVIDTLIVFFTEKIDIKSGRFELEINNKLNLKDLREGEDYFINENSVTFLIDIENVDILPNRDNTVYITGLNLTIEDQYGNKGTFTKKHSVVIVKANYQAQYNVKIGPNPVDLGKDEIVHISVSPYAKRPAVGLSAIITVYDNLGNIVIGEQEFIYNDDIGELNLSLKPRNQQGRKLGSGSYLAVIMVTNSNGDTDIVQKIPVMIGVKR